MLNLPNQNEAGTIGRVVWEIFGVGDRWEGCVYVRAKSSSCVVGNQWIMPTALNRREGNVGMLFRDL